MIVQVCKMEYPELNIGEFASKYSADIEVEKHADEDGYLVMIDVEPGEDERYPVSVGARPQTIEQLADLYRNQFVNFPADELITVYGSDNGAVRSMRETNSEARFEAPDEEIKESYESKGWAVDVEPILRQMEESQYEEVIDEISTFTLYIVNRAESNGEVGPELHDFHWNLVREFTPRQSEPIKIDVVEEFETGEEYVDVGENGAENEELLERTDTRPGFDYEEIVSGTINESKSRIEEIQDDLDEEDWKALLEAEREGDDRVTFKPYLKERLREERSEDMNNEEI